MISRDSDTSKVMTRDGREVQLRPLQTGDLKSLLDFANSLARERRSDPLLGLLAFDRPMTTSKEAKFLRGVLQGSKKGNVVDVAAVYEGRIVGHCDVTRRVFPSESHSGVYGIAVLKAFRGVGLGEAMTRTVLKEARRVGIRIVELEVFSTNSIAKALYRKVGFRDAGSIPKKVRRGRRYIDADLMYIDLGKR